MRIETRREWKVNILDLSGNITIGKGDVVLRDAIGELLQAGEKLFLLNMDEVGYVDSASIGEVVATFKRVSERDGTIKLVLPERGKAQKVFMMASLDRVFEIFGDEAAALASFPMDAG